MLHADYQNVNVVLYLVASLVTKTTLTFQPKALGGIPHLNLSLPAYLNAATKQSTLGLELFNTKIIIH